MPRSDEFDEIRDSLDKVEYLMDLEQRLSDEINSDRSLSDEQRHRLLLDVARRIENWNWDEGGMDDDSALAIYVRKLGPRGPESRSGSIALQPELDDPAPDAIAEPPSRRQQRPFEDSSGIR